MDALKWTLGCIAVGLNFAIGVYLSIVLVIFSLCIVRHIYKKLFD